MIPMYRSDQLVIIHSGVVGVFAAHVVLQPAPAVKTNRRYVLVGTLGTSSSVGLWVAINKPANRSISPSDLSITYAEGLTGAAGYT